jgi:hypothetical protein
VELENWVNSIHSACAAAFARHRGKTGTLHLLQEEIYRIEKGIESVSSERSSNLRTPWPIRQHQKVVTSTSNISTTDERK